MGKVKAIMIHVAIENFLAEVDGIIGAYVGMNNFYLYRFERTTLFTFIPGTRARPSPAGPSTASGATCTTCRPGLGTG